MERFDQSDPVFACCASSFPERPVIDVAETPWTQMGLDARIDHWMTQLTMLAAWGEREVSTQSGVCTVTVTEFLEARIAEDEALAKAAIANYAPDEWDNPSHWANHYAADVEFWDAVTPARVLAECAAKRQVIGLHAAFGRSNEPGAGAAWGALGAALQDLAAVYSDHPDYNKDWAL